MAIVINLIVSIILSAYPGNGLIVLGVRGKASSQTITWGTNGTIISECGNGFGGGIFKFPLARVFPKDDVLKTSPSPFLP